MATQEAIAAARAPAFPNTFRAALNEGKLVATLMPRAVTSHLVGQIAANSGFEAVIVDMEHSVVGLETASGIFSATLSAGITPLVRVPVCTSEWVSRSLDGGAMGVVIPHVNSADEARLAVKYAKFAPIGERSISGGMLQFRLQNTPSAASSYVCNEMTLVICMIETARAVDVVDEILAVEGVDMLHVGTHDLADDLGITGDLGNEKIFEMYSRISDAAARASKNGRKVFIGMGGLQGRPDIISRLVNEDKNKLIRYISTQDFPIYTQAMAKTAKEMTSLLK
ncbi:Pyruvate/Phosphoenolpyruvate kinase [Niveomyces insectorum RCEF 264]|uniref:Pyruvate/Phosphoenolpyruvate kinase n=1 Tax=Niveomyces insectorum RCEF 264 TaxID=1081102 RepID=A0A162J8J4_9HYPO|nr:Pyruvate/Phosphoenolpyruvate kinase [Niveomyces insectorum RCEF 264]